MAFLGTFEWAYKFFMSYDIIISHLNILWGVFKMGFQWNLKNSIQTLKWREIDNNFM